MSTSTPNLRCEALEGDGQVGLADAPEQRLVGLVVALDDRAPGPRPGGGGGRRRACRRRPGCGPDGDRRAPSGGGSHSGHPHRRALRGQRVAGARCRPAWRRRRCRRPRRRSVGSCSLPRRWNRPCSRSSAPVRRVDELVVGADGARQHLEQRELADVGVGDGLEHERQRLAGGVGGDLGLRVAGVDGDRPVGRRRADLADEVGQAVDADARERPSRTPRGTRSPSATPWARVLLQLLRRSARRPSR